MVRPDGRPADAAKPVGLRPAPGCGAAAAAAVRGLPGGRRHQCQRAARLRRASRRLPGRFARVGVLMTNGSRQALQVFGAVEAVNAKGFRISGRWLNWSRWATSVTPLEPGQTVTVTLDKDG